MGSFYNPLCVERFVPHDNQVRINFGVAFFFNTIERIEVNVSGGDFACKVNAIILFHLQGSAFCFS